MHLYSTRRGRGGGGGGRACTGRRYSYAHFKVLLSSCTSNYILLNTDSIRKSNPPRLVLSNAPRAGVIPGPLPVAVCHSRPHGYCALCKRARTCAVALCAPARRYFPFLLLPSARHGWLLWMCRRDGKCPERNGRPRPWPRLFRAHAQYPSATCERVAPPAWPSPRPSTGGAGWVT